MVPISLRNQCLRSPWNPEVGFRWWCRRSTEHSRNLWNRKGQVRAGRDASWKRKLDEEEEGPWPSTKANSRISLFESVKGFKAVESLLNSIAFFLHPSSNLNTIIQPLTEQADLIEFPPHDPIELRLTSQRYTMTFVHLFTIFRVLFIDW